MKSTIVYGRVTEIYRDADWIAYAGEPRPSAGEKPSSAVRIAVSGQSNEKVAMMVMDVVLAPEVAHQLELGSWVKVEVGPATEKEAERAQEKKAA